VTATIDADLIAWVDAYVRDNPTIARSAVIDDALRLWVGREQDLAMERQLLEDRKRPGAAHAAWRRVRAAGARRAL
jgi:hypothetical protein